MVPTGELLMDDNSGSSFHCLFNCGLIIVTPLEDPLPAIFFIGRAFAWVVGPHSVSYVRFLNSMCFFLATYSICSFLANFCCLAHRYSPAGSELSKLADRDVAQSHEPDGRCHLQAGLPLPLPLHLGPRRVPSAWR